MTTLLMDGFDHYGAGSVGEANMLEGPWATVLGSGLGGPTSPPWGTRTGEFAITSGIFGTSYRRVLPAPKTALIVGLGFSVASLPSASLRNSVIGFLNGAGAGIASLWVGSTGTLELYDAASTLIAASQAPVIVASNWHYLEMKIDIDAQSFELHVDDADGTGTPVIAATGLSLGGPIGQFTVLGSGNGAALNLAYLDDLIVRDTSGLSNNGFEGDLRIAALYPRGDDPTHAGWTPRYRKEFGDGILDNRAANNACVTAAASANTNLGAADFTIEQFVRFFTLPTGATKAQIFGKWDETSNARSYQLYLGGPSLDSGNLVFRTSTDGQAGTVAQKIAYPWEPELNVWYHLAVVRTSGELLLFIDGVQFGLPIADADVYFAGGATTAIGAQCDGIGSAIAATAFTGFMDEVRLSVGVARYTTPFTPAGPFPRSSPDDPDFASVAVLCGFDSGINDESSFGRALTARNGAVQNTPDDGPTVGAFSTLNQHAPRDDTFIEAPLTVASSILTLAAQPDDGDTVTVGTTDGSTAAVYTFKTAISAAYDVLVDTSTVLTLQNLFNAINEGAGIGTKYGTGTLSNFDVAANQVPGDQMQVTALTPGSGGNSIATTAALTNGGFWDGSTLAGGADIPGPSDFPIDRPPPLTTVVKAVAVVQRSYKSDAGTCNVMASFVGPLGGAVDASPHALTVSPVYYEDIFETDPDTGNAITATTLVGGRIRFTRTG